MVELEEKDLFELSAAAEMHPCPFQEDINGNSEPYCTCTENEMLNCAMDI